MRKAGNTTKKELISKFAALRQRVAELENDMADRGAIEEALKASEARFRVILDQLRDGLLLADKESKKFLMGNPAIHKMLGWSAEELHQLEVRDIHPEQELPWVLDRFEALARKEIEIARDIPVRRKDGGVFYADISSSLPMVFNGKECLTGIFRDTTERRMTEEALRESEARYRTIFNNAIEGIFQTTLDGRCRTINPAFAQMFGYGSPEEMITTVTNIAEQLYVHPEDRKRLIAMLSVSDGMVRDFEVQFRRRDGSLLWVSINALMIRNGERDAPFLEGTCIDITARKETDKALRDSETKYRRIVDTANEGIWSVDENFITTFVNRRMARMLGYDEPEMIGRPVHWFMLEEDLANLLEKMRDRRAGISDRYERRYRHKDGRSVWVILSVTPLVDDEDGSFKGSFAMVTDISDRKQMEEELFRSRDELELRVRERTIELEAVNSQLRSIPSKLIAVQEDERKRIAGELHDSVGQTLAALKYGIETVLVKKDGGDLVGAFNLLERFVPTLQRSIDETRGIYMGLRPLMLDSLGLRATLEWFCREFQSLHSSFRLELKTKIKEEEIPDMTKIIIFRIVQEALNNAAKHSRAKRVNLLLAKSRSSIELTIKDDGKGFEPDSVLSHNDLKSLGLTGMRDRAKLGGGIFTIESTPGKGTVLRASWPAR